MVHTFVTGQLCPASYVWERFGILLDILVLRLVVHLVLASMHCPPEVVGTVGVAE